MKNICVFCSSRDLKNSEYKKATVKLAELIAKSGYTALYGGSGTGLMKIFSENIQKNKGKIIGVIPEVFAHLESPDDEVVKTKDFAERKATMILRSDAFICLPGGYGTIDEASDVIVGKLINLHTKPLVFVNTQGFYDNLLRHFDRMINEGFTDKIEGLYGVVETPAGAIEYIKNYKAKTLQNPFIKG